ncbi:alpha-N-arabinofuranosidase [Altererythrobacter salegens]|uniref:non-reducing end alpha-L-arabinofuranosidase n=1 Tax=Croceibacterium salegens TaxID=1737568 RepID=A0A6I4T0R1_9SPHN|nr:alpha-L-arabinofuranosidase C-terminal domain-containing protein [Croceibacterium salegens]MXO60836.1 alpha-N-arabinofuranosidase [Croceibacterium salegens]
MNRYFTSAAALALAMLPLAAQAQDTVVTIDTAHPGATIDRNIFGQFAEHLGTGIYGGVWVGPASEIPNVRGIRSDVVAALKAIKVPNVRWPGGCFADEYHWKNGIGAASARRATVNANWGGAIEPNSFGTDEFFDFIGQIGSEAYVSVNVGSGTLEEASEWMAYMTADQRSAAGADRAKNGHAAPYRVKYLGIGNESWGCGGNMRPEYYTDLLKRYARFSRNYNPAQQGEGNPDTMQRIAVGPTDDDTAYTEGVMKAWAERDWSWSIEGLSLHSYTVPQWPPSLPSTEFGEDDYALILATTLKMDARIAKHAAIMDRYDPEKVVPLAVDEWGVWLRETPGTPSGFLQQQNSLRDGILAALNFNIFARHADRVRMANIAQMVNVLQALILTDGPKMVRTPTYWVHQMYLPMQDATFVPVSFDAGTYTRGAIAMPAVDAVAMRAKDGKLWLSLVNLDPHKSRTIAIEGLKAKSATGEVLTAANVSSINTFDAPNTVVPKPIAGILNSGKVSMILPAKSVVVIALGE